MVVTNLVTFLSYVSICLTLLYLAGKTRRAIARDWAHFAVFFALFIVACGSTHLLEVITTWIPIFWIDAWTNIITAVLSAYVAVQLVRRARIIGFSMNDYADRLGRTEIEKQKMVESLLDAQKLEDWSRLSATVSHEIGNPLEAIQNLLYLIRTSDGVPNEVLDYAQQAAEEAERVVTISRSTLAFFRSATRPEPVDLHAAAESVGFLLSGVMQQKNIALEIHDDGDVVVEAMPGEARQVLLNLVRNACEATSEPGANITLTLEGHSETVDVTVADHGTGIPPEVLSRLFHFGMSTKGDAGNGMGLWTVKQIMAKHGGDVHVDTVIGKGTRFVLSWPRRYSARLAAD
jgi:signal transduction histidine kinase